jgi:hypothetical protein
MDSQFEEVDRLQRVIAKLIATAPAGVKLLLIGGFRLRLLDQSHRFSVDIGYHWDGDLQQKQEELLRFCRRAVLSEVIRICGYDGSVAKRQGTDAESPNAAFIDFRFWKPGLALEIPVEITKILCLDPPTVRTADGTVHMTPSDADLIESKILAVLNRLYLQHRDLLDVFLYKDKLRPDSNERIKQKLAALALAPEAVRKKLEDLERYKEYHATAIQKVIDTQLETAVAQQLNAGGGGQAVLADSLKVINRVCPV